MVFCSGIIRDLELKIKPRETYRMILWLERDYQSDALS